MKDDEYAKFCELIINTRRSSVRMHANAECIVCKAIAKEMLSVGSLFFCFPCYRVEFKTEDPIREEKEKYSFWYQKFLEEERRTENGR